MDHRYFSSLLELWELDESELECSTLLNTTTSWAECPERGEVDETARIASVAAAKTTVVSVGSVYGSREERASCRVALGEVKPEEGRKELVDVTTGRKQEQMPVVPDEGKVCGLEEDAYGGNELKGLERQGVLRQSLGGCTSGKRCNCVPGKVGGKGELSGGELACPCCKHCNEVGTHWCSDCGTALLAPLSNCSHASSSMNLSFRHETDSLSDCSSNMQLQSPSSTLCDDHLSSYSEHDSLEGQNPAQGSTLDCVVEISSQKGITGQSCRKSGKYSERSYPDKPTVQSRQMHETQGRFWSTSRMYHWRKPSSLKPVVSSPLEKLKQSTVSRNIVHHVFQEDSGNLRSTSVSNIPLHCT